MQCTCSALMCPETSKIHLCKHVCYGPIPYKTSVFFVASLSAKVGATFVVTSSTMRLLSQFRFILYRVYCSRALRCVKLRSLCAAALRIEEKIVLTQLKVIIMSV